MRPTLWVTLMYLALMPWAQAATFDCDKASNFVEKVICSDSRLNSMDDQLGRLYKDALPASSNSGALKMEQKAWLSSRNQCKDSDCIMKAYTDRISALNAMTAPAKAGDFTGTYQMNTGELTGEIPLTGNSATYVDKEFDCTLSFTFAPGTLGLTQNGSCG